MLTYYEHNDAPNEAFLGWLHSASPKIYYHNQYESRH